MAEAAVRELPGAWNFRDVADGARRAAARATVPVQRAEPPGRRRPGNADAELGITDVADLRAAREVARRGPGLVPDGVDVHLLPFPDLGDDEPVTTTKPRTNTRSGDC